MFEFGETSKSKLITAHPDLQLIMNTAIRISPIDMAVIEGHRNKIKQNKYYATGASKVQFPKGKHNTIPSNAIDVAPYVENKVSWDHRHCCVLAGTILTIASALNIFLRWGGCWNGDPATIGKQKFEDLVHFERMEQ